MKNETAPAERPVSLAALALRAHSQPGVRGAIVITIRAGNQADAQFSIDADLHPLQLPPNLRRIATQLEKQFLLQAAALEKSKRSETK